MNNEIKKLPAVGDSIVRTFPDGSKIHAVIKSMRSATYGKVSSGAQVIQINPGGVTIVEALGYAYSIHPLTWMDEVLSGAIVLEA